MQLFLNVFAGAAVAAAVFFLTYANGGFDTTTRAYAGIAAWWLLGAAAAIGIGSARARLSRLAVTPPVLLALFAVWTLISVAWAPDTGGAVAQFDLVSLYVAVLVLAIVVARLVPARTLLSGIALALSAVAVVAFVSRAFPSTFGVIPGSQILPVVATRLSFPLGYWNGLGIDIALAYPLLLATMAGARSWPVRALAALPLPLIAADMYLTSSRGAFVAGAFAIVVYLLLTPRRWTAVAATAVAAVGAVVAVAVLHSRRDFVAGDMTTSSAVSQGHHAAFLLALVCVASALVWLGLTQLGKRVPAPPTAVGWGAAGLVVVLVIVGVVLAHPVAKFDAFKSLPPPNGYGSNFTNAHLLSSSGSGRWQIWGSAVSEFDTNPFHGGGAGSYQYWWLQHGSLPGLFIGDAHSVYLSAMAELGIVGLLLVAGALLVAAAGAVRAAIVVRSGELAAAAACGLAFCAAAAYDWIWLLTGIGVVAFACLGIALGALPSGRASVWGRFGFSRALLALVAVAAIVPQLIVLAAGIHLRNSQSASAAGNPAHAESEALAARAVEPWSAEPYRQLALIDERLGRYVPARHWIAAAIERSSRDWTLWEEAAVIDLKRGDARAAQRDIQEMERLNPSVNQATVKGKG